MLFNSTEFIVVFLPIVLIVYFQLAQRGYYTASKIWLVAASLFFYGWWNPRYLLLLAASVSINFGIAWAMLREGGPARRKGWLVAGIVFNLGLLGYYKYANFFIDNINAVAGSDFNLLHIILPLGISFFTFQQIAYLVDTCKGIVAEYDFLHYTLFVSFFPPLLSGPITHHKEVMPQLRDPQLARVNYDNIARGIFVFNMGLAKKIMIADTFGEIANNGYSHYLSLTTAESWMTSFAYTVQLYFDFSGYSDMAIGTALMFNIRLPNNFWSPHKSESIQQFYRRWHITLSRFLRDYVYIPLGGNQKREWRTHLNLFLTFLIGGLWHGANWTFVAWGALNGLGLIVHRLYQKTRIGMPHLLAVAITFLFVMVVRIFFRASDFGTAIKVLQTMAGFGDPVGKFELVSSFYNAPLWIAGVVLLFMPNSTEMGERFKASPRFAAYTSLLALANFTFLNSVAKQDFLYFDF